MVEPNRIWTVRVTNVMEWRLIKLIPTHISLLDMEWEQETHTLHLVG